MILRQPSFIFKTIYSYSVAGILNKRNEHWFETVRVICFKGSSYATGTWALLLRPVFKTYFVFFVIILYKDGPLNKPYSDWRVPSYYNLTWSWNQALFSFRLDGTTKEENNIRSDLSYTADKFETFWYTSWLYLPTSNYLFIVCFMAKTLSRVSIHSIHLQTLYSYLFSGTDCNKVQRSWRWKKVKQIRYLISNGASRALNVAFRMHGYSMSII